MKFETNKYIVEINNDEDILEIYNKENNIMCELNLYLGSIWLKEKELPYKTKYYVEFETEK